MMAPRPSRRLSGLCTLKSLDDSPPLDLGFLQIDGQTQRPARGSQIVETLRCVFVGERCGFIGNYIEDVKGYMFAQFTLPGLLPAADGIVASLEVDRGERCLGEDHSSVGDQRGAI